MKTLLEFLQGYLSDHCRGWTNERGLVHETVGSSDHAFMKTTLPALQPPLQP